MGTRDLIAYAADQYGVDRGLLDNVARLESGYRTNVQNNWDSNAQAGIPSYGLMQFIKPTFDSFARQAAKANPNAWARYNGQYDYKDPRQQALAAAWGFKNGKGSHWSTYDRAKAAAGSYNYKPKWSSTPGVAGQTTTRPAVNPQQLAEVSRQYDSAISVAKQNQQAAFEKRNKFDTLTQDQKDALAYRGNAYDASFGEYRMPTRDTAPTAAEQHVSLLKDEAVSVLEQAKQNVATLAKQKNNTLARLKQKKLVVEAEGIAAEAGWNGQGNPFKFLESRFGLKRSSSDNDAPGVHTRGSFHYRPAQWGGVQGYDYGDAANSPAKLRQLAAYIRQNYKQLGINEFFYDPLGWKIDEGKLMQGVQGGHNDHVHLAIDRLLGGR